MESIAEWIVYIGIIAVCLFILRIANKRADAERAEEEAETHAIYELAEELEQIKKEYEDPEEAS